MITEQPADSLKLAGELLDAGAEFERPADHLKHAAVALEAVRQQWDGLNATQRIAFAQAHATLAVAQAGRRRL